MFHELPKKSFTNIYELGAWGVGGRMGKRLNHLKYIPKCVGGRGKLHSLHAVPWKLEMPASCSFVV